MNGDRAALREAAVALRRQGKSRRQIAQALGIRGNNVLDELLDGEPPPEWTKRPRAKDDLRVKARELRAQGWTYRQIANALGVSIGSCSLWLRDMPPPSRPEPGSYEQERVAAAWRARWEGILERREISRQQTKLQAGREIGDLSRRDLIMAAAIAYWCEGSKDKSYARREQVIFMNSDPRLIRLFSRFLDAVGVENERRVYRLHIHETGDVEASTRYWAALLGVPLERFTKPTIKRHSPKTNRKNLRDEYRGCLQISVRQSAELYRRIEGWVTGTIVGAERTNLAAGEPTVGDWRLVRVPGRSAVG
jgi:transcriptional regulator with XRE-family HTH domain